MHNSALSYREGLRYLYGLQKYGIKFGLSKTSNLMEAFGNPHQGRAYIHIGGTNGKGSVATLLESVLRRAGLRVGFYSSPHLVSFTERFRINGEPISTEEAAGLTRDIMEVIVPENEPTFFEVTTAMALLYFARKETDIAIMEVGMGGRLDATNIITPLVSVITNIALEHQGFLGSRLLDIAAEKAGIIKPAVDLVTGVTQPAVVRLFQATCETRGAPMWRVGKDLRYRSRLSTFDYYGLRRRIRDGRLGLRGRFQFRNAALAMGALEILEKKGYRFPEEDIRAGLESARWPGRVDVLSEKPLIVLDGAHNPAAVRALVDTVRREFTYKRLVLVLGVMDDKDISSMLGTLVPEADHVIFTQPVYFRSARAADVSGQAKALLREGEVLPSVPRALDRARELADEEDMILVCGSLFLVGESLTHLDPQNYPAEEI